MMKHDLSMTRIEIFMVLTSYMLSMLFDVVICYWLSWMLKCEMRVDLELISLNSCAVFNSVVFELIGFIGGSIP